MHNQFSLETRTETVHTINGDDLESFIYEKYGFTADAVGEGEVPGGDSEGFIFLDDVENKPLTKEQEEYLHKDYKEYRWSITVLHLALQYEISEGRMPAGKYKLEFCWG